MSLFSNVIPHAAKRRCGTYRILTQAGALQTLGPASAGFALMRDDSLENQTA